MKKLLVGFVILTVLLFVFFLEGFAYYKFLPPELNAVLESWKNKPPESEYGYYYAIISDSNGTTSFLDPVPYVDVLSAPTNIKIGEEWTGPSGRTYLAVLPASKETGAEQIDTKLDSTLVPIDSVR
jgi:hypothetical protein